MIKISENQEEAQQSSQLVKSVNFSKNISNIKQVFTQKDQDTKKVMQNRPASHLKKPVPPSK